MAEKWQIEGTIFDACNCLTLCPCNYFQSPTGSDCRATVIWRITAGKFGATRLNSLNVAGVLYANQNPLMGIEKLGHHHR